MKPLILSEESSLPAARKKIQAANGFSIKILHVGKHIQEEQKRS